MTRLKRLLSIISTIGFGIILAVILLEIIGRVLHLVPSPLPESYQEVRELVGRYPEPYSYFWFEREDGQRIWVQFNYRSLRDIDHSYDKADDTTRIMFLGDSFTAGWQVPLAETYTGRLRDWLADTNDYDFINAGLHGWGTDRQLLYYQTDGYRYDSDVVVLQIYVGNDILDNGIAVLENRIMDDGRRIMSHELGQDRPSFTLDNAGQLVLRPPTWLPETRIEQIGDVRSFLRHYTFTYALLEQLAQLFKADNTPPVETVNPETNFTRRFPVDYYAFSPETETLDDWQAAWDISQALILELKREVEAQGGTFMVLLVDVRWKHDLAGFEALRTQWDFPADWQAEHWTGIMRDFLEDEKIPYLEPLDALLSYQATTGHDIVFRKDGHWTAEGQCVVAVELHNWLIERNIFSDSINPRDALDNC